jgi:bacillolysin
MRRVSSLVLVAAAVWIFNSRPAAQQTNPASAPASNGLVAATTVSDLRLWDAFLTDGSRNGALRLRSAVRDPMLPSRTIERFEQYYRGVRIWGADVVRDSENGVPFSIFGALSGDIRLSTDPAMTADDARGALLAARTNQSVLLTQPELVIFRLDSGDVRLAYTAVLSASRTVMRVFVDAHTGTELMRYRELQTQEPAVGSGTGVLGDRKKMSVESNGGTYVAYDRHRPPVIQTFDMRGNLARAKLLFDGLLPYTFSDLASDSDNVWSDVSVTDAHVHVSWTYDYYFKRFGRSGLDGRDGPIDIVVNAVTQQGALSIPGDDFRDFALQAFFCSNCGPGGRGVMYFGNGIPSGFVSAADGRHYTYLSGALDVAAHELTHAVTDATSQLIYRDESGALNEAFSDIIGKSVEFFYHPAGSEVGQADYVVGKDVIRATRAGMLNGIRSMANPGLYGDPDHYSRRYRGSEDNGGVHINSGIPNQAFYLAVEGGTNRTSGVTVQGVGSAQREQMEKIFYRAFTLLMPANASFSTARAATLQAARDLYGPGGAPETALARAWTAVGVN